MTKKPRRRTKKPAPALPAVLHLEPHESGWCVRIRPAYFEAANIDPTMPVQVSRRPGGGIEISAALTQHLAEPVYGRKPR